MRISTFFENLALSPINIIVIIVAFFEIIILAPIVGLIALWQWVRKKVKGEK